MISNKPILIAGPTASGKSALAIGLAKELNGVVVNADSLQIYNEWRVLTARPSNEEENLAPHRLYGHISVSQEYSAGHWLRDITPILHECENSGKTPIIVGGTGLYFHALTNGLVEIQKIPDEIREMYNRKFADHGLESLQEELKKQDPEICETIDLNNPRRVIRALEVLKGTGKAMSAWQSDTPPAILPIDKTYPIVLMPPRDWLYDRCALRFDLMINQGALDEAKNILNFNPTPSALNAIGAKELIAYLNGEITKHDAIEQSVMQTRQYAKRQYTWFKNRMLRYNWLKETDSCANLQKSLQNYKNTLDQ